MRCTRTSDRRWSLNAVDKRVSSLKQLELNVSTQEGIKYCCSLFLIFIFKMPPKPSKPIALTLEQRVEVVKQSEKNNLSARKIAEHFGVGRILKRRVKRIWTLPRQMRYRNFCDETSGKCVKHAS